MTYVTKWRQTSSQPFEVKSELISAKIGHAESLCKYNFTEMKGAFFYGW